MGEAYEYPDRFPYPADELYYEILKAGYGIIPISASDALEVRSLSYPTEGVKPHQDPFDRIMLAQAKNRHMYFLTADGLIPHYNETCVITAY